MEGGERLGDEGFDHGKNGLKNEVRNGNPERLKFYRKNGKSHLPVFSCADFLFEYSTYRLVGF